MAIFSDLMRNLVKEQGASVVQIGISGKGTLPNVAADSAWMRGALDGLTFKTLQILGTSPAQGRTRAPGG